MSQSMLYYIQREGETLDSNLTYSKENHYENS